MTRQLNPFISGKPVPPTHFIGREEVINNCYNRLAGPVRSSIAISGEHGIGKTSLLHYLDHLAQAEQWGQPHTHNIFLYLDCQTIEQFTPTRFWRRVLERLRQAEDNLDLQQQVDELLQLTELDATHFQRILRWLDRQPASLVLLLDGFTSIVKTDSGQRAMTSDFLSSLRALINHPDYSLTLLTATREPLDVLCYDIVKEQGSPFYNNFTFQSLASFTPGEIDTLLHQALSQAGFEFDPADRRLLQHMAGAHPALLQTAGYHIFEVRRQGPLTQQHYKKIIEDFEKSARHYFVQFWHESSALERTLFILIILLRLAEQSTRQLDMGVEEIQALLQTYERDLIRLVEQGLIQKVEGIYQIFSDVFAWWMVREVAVISDTDLAGHYQTITVEPLRRAWETLKKLAPYLTLDALSQTLTTRPTRPPATPLLPSRYELQAEIGRGASGIVYKVFDTRLTRQVAIKWLHSYLRVSSTDSRLLKEARAASQLQHPHIVTVYDVVEANGQIFLVMEYLEGQTLVELLRKEKRLPLAQVIILVEQAAAALDYAHAQGIIHRDIKPANLMIIPTNILKLTDFGIAKIAGDPQTTHGSEFKGTVIYMSPEQTNQQPLDGRSDLFSLATVTFEMLSGASPWPGQGVLELMTQIATAPPLSLAPFAGSNAAELDVIFQKALAKDPAERFQRGADFVQALKQVTAG